MTAIAQTQTVPVAPIDTTRPANDCTLLRGMAEAVVENPQKREEDQRNRQARAFHTARLKHAKEKERLLIACLKLAQWELILVGIVTIIHGIKLLLQ